MKIEIFEGEWTIEDVKNNPEYLYVFGDNNARVGKGGQAIIRDLPNTIGLRTKKGPSTKLAAYYSDSELEKNIKNIRQDILKIKSELLNGKTIVFSSGGYGTGLAKLKQLAPKTFEYLTYMLKLHFHFDNETGKRWLKVPGHDELAFAKYISFDKENSTLLQPINNSFFRQEFLSNGLNSNYDLIKSSNKVAFTSNWCYKPAEVIIFTFSGLSDYLVCRVIDSYEVDSLVDKNDWYLFEGYEPTFELNPGNYFQTHFEYISTLDEKGNMVYRDGIFSDTKLNKKNAKKVGEKIINTMKEDEILEILRDLKNRVEKLESKKLFRNPFKKSLIELLKKQNMNGEIKEFKDDSSKHKYQVKSGDTYFVVQFNEGFFKNSIEVILSSKNPLI